MQLRRVVVTGMGMLSPVGGNLDESWKNLLAGKSGISKIEHFDTTDFSVKIAGLVKEEMSCQALIQKLMKETENLLKGTAVYE